MAQCACVCVCVCVSSAIVFHRWHSFWPPPSYFGQSGRSGSISSMTAYSSVDEHDLGPRSMRCSLALRRRCGYGRPRALASSHAASSWIRRRLASLRLIALKGGGGGEGGPL
ncbi:hypothetical protein LZ30DRAFT_715043, partial [Colletotrichum cereale]